jgi:hypothetical protein
VINNNDDLPRPSKAAGAGEAYNCVQIDLFSNFVCNTIEERNRLSNAIDIWDSTPRYSVSRKEQTKRRDSNGGLPLLTIPYEYRGQRYTATIQPAMVQDGDQMLAYYPSASEELVEDALRKIAVRQNQGFNQGFFEKQTARSGVSFSLHELREELADRGHTRSYYQIIQSLTILRRSHIEIKAGDGRGESLIAANYLPAMAAVSQKQLADDPSSRWVAQFHPLVTQSIDRLTYRQFNYDQMMRHSTQLARWLHRQLALKFTFAGLTAPDFEVRYSTIKRDSAMLNRGQERDNRKDVDEAFAELVRNGVLQKITKKSHTAARGKVIDVTYLLKPSPEFVKEMKAANKRASGQAALADAAQKAARR